MKLAEPRDKGTWISPEGHALLGEILRENGKRNAMTITVLCPVCQAKPGQPCTSPTNDGRRPVGYLHMNRVKE